MKKEIVKPLIGGLVATVLASTPIRQASAEDCSFNASLAEKSNNRGD